MRLLILEAHFYWTLPEGLGKMIERDKKIYERFRQKKY